jgi:hypothetical protein
MAAATLIEALTDVPAQVFNRDRWVSPTHEDDDCKRCLLGIEARHPCHVCAQFEPITQYPHLDGNVCLRHAKWIGPGTPPEAQVDVNDECRKADLRFRRLCRMRRMDAYRYAELTSIIRTWLSGSGQSGGVTTWYPRLVFLGELVTDTKFMNNFLSKVRTYAESYELLTTAIGHGFPEADATVVDGVWRLLRPQALRVWETLHYGKAQSDEDVHELMIPFEPVEAVFPLEPFERFSMQLRTCLADRWVDLLARNACRVSSGTLPIEVDPRSSSVVYFVCDRGHRQSRNPRAMHRTLTGGGCAICSGQFAKAQFNSLCETHPKLALMWHPLRNGDQEPHEFRFGSKQRVWWLCESYHEWQAPISKNNGCPECRAASAVRKSSALWDQRQDLQWEWMESRNNRSWRDVYAHSSFMAWWRCNARHNYQKRVRERFRGGGCPECSTRELKKGTNDLGTADPTVSREWDIDRNKPLLPSDAHWGSNQKVWWLCQFGHSWRTSISERTRRGTQCPVCAGNRLEVGFNDLATLQPRSIELWHPTLNGETRPSDLFQASFQYVYWLCECGLTYRRQPSRQKRSGWRCPRCGK